MIRSSYNIRYKKLSDEQHNYILRNIYKGAIPKYTMENKIKQKALSFFKRLFNRRYLDLNLLNKLKQNGIKPVLLYSK